MEAAELTPEGFDALQAEKLKSRVQVYPARSWHPSAIGHPCDRHLVYRWTRWQEQKPHDYVLQSIFDQGNAYQPLAYQRLESLGFEIVRESDRPRQWTLKNGAVISGRIDGKVLGFRGQRYAEPLLCEIKTMQGYSWEKYATIDDIRESPQHYIRGYFAQTQLYLVLEEMQAGVIVLMNKANGLLRVIPLELDLEYAEGLLQRVERLQGLLDAKADPPPIDYDFGVCGGCGFLELCWPPRSFGDGASIIEDTTLIEMLERRQELDKAATEYDELDKAVKSKLKHAGVKQAIAGPFLIEGSERSRKEYTVKASSFVVYNIEKMEVQGNGKTQS